MAIKIQIPATPLNVFKTGLLRKGDETWYKWALKSIWNHYGPIFRECEAMHNVPAEVMCTLVSIELPDSSEPALRKRMERIVTGDPKTGATGMCQINCYAADLALREEAQADNLSQEEIAYFRSKLGARYDTIMGKGSFGQYRGRNGAVVHTIKDLSDPTYNIHIGTLHFGQLLRQHTGADGVMRIDRAIPRYNGSSAPIPPAGASVAAVIASQKGKNKGRDKNTTFKYILKFIGTGGGMDLLTKNQA